VVTEVKDGSPAEAAGIQQGDVITKVIRDHKPQALSSVKDLQDLASKSDELGLYVQRGKVGAFRVLSKNAN
jgi:serine protease Do